MVPADAHDAPVPWYRTLFADFYYDVWFRRSGTPAEQTAAAQREVDRIERLLALPAGSRILDLACGHGRHAVELARRGYRVTGLDLSPQHIALARAAARAATVTVDWVEADMRAVPTGPFDAVINLFTAFGFLESDEEDQRVLDGVGRSLRPGGRFLLDVPNREQVLQTVRGTSWQPLADGSLFLQAGEVDLHTSRWQTRTILVTPDGQREEHQFVVRLYSLTEYRRMVGAAGLTLQQAWGGLDGTPYRLESPRLVLQAERTT